VAAFVLRVSRRPGRQSPFPRSGQCCLDYAIAQVNKHLTTETRVVIEHSLGSVVAYDTLRTRPSDQPVPLLVTLGSPLGAVGDQPTASTSAPGVSRSGPAVGQHRRTRRRRGCPP
jgi:hypothetical protein